MAAAALEAIMLVCFGLSWPINAMKAWESGTAVSKWERAAGGRAWTA